MKIRVLLFWLFFIAIYRIWILCSRIGFNVLKLTSRINRLIFNRNNFGLLPLPDMCELNLFRIGPFETLTVFKFCEPRSSIHSKHNDST